MINEIEEQLNEHFPYAKRSDLDRLSATVDALIAEFRESKQQMLQFSLDFAKETGKFSMEVEKLAEVIDEMQLQLGKLVDSNLRRSIIIEWVHRCPKFISTVFGLVTLIGLFFTTDANKDFFHYLIAIEKAKYGVQTSHQVMEHQTPNKEKNNG